MGRKKKPETLKKERDKLQSEIDNLNQLKKEKEAEIELEKRIEKKQDIIREDLKSQLLQQNKYGEYMADMVEDYVYFFGLKERLKYDINMNGIRYKSTTGNGFKVDKPNESVKNLPTINSQMLKILSDLNLKEPEVPSDDGDDDNGLL